MTESILYIHVAEPITHTLAKAAETLEALERGATVTPYFSLGFSDMSQLLATLTPRRWQLMSLLREQGPLTLSELTQRFGNDTDQIAQDIQILLDWNLVQQDADSRISAPYSELVVDVKFPSAQAA